MKATHERKFAGEKIVPYQVDELVWLKSPESTGLSKSLATKSLGSFKIVNLDDVKNVTIQKTGDTAQVVKMKDIRRALPISQLPLLNPMCDQTRAKSADSSQWRFHWRILTKS